MNVEIANRLQMLRKKNGYSQEELAEKIGISRQAVSKWERAEASPDTDNLILLAKLYGITIDELLSTDNAMPNSEGISLRKEDYTYKTADDDGEIYPERHSIPQGSENRSHSGTAYGEDIHGYYDASRSESAGNASDGTVEDPAEFIRAAADFAVNVAKEAAGTAKKAFSEADERVKNGENREKSMEESFEKNFSGFGEKVETFGENFAEKMEGFGKRVERRFENLEKRTENNFEAHTERHEQAERKKAEKASKHEKYPATLLDKLFPLIIVCLFFMMANEGFADIAWLLFFFIPVYYIFSDSRKRCRAGKITPVQALIRFINGALPIGVAFLFFFLGMTTRQWEILWTMFFIIPLYYTAMAAVKKSNLLIFCYPAAAAWAFFGVGIIFGEWMFGLTFLATIPFYYIIVDHYRQKRK